MAKSDLTPERLRELLHYDQKTGVFTWFFKHNSCRNKLNAGSLNKRKLHIEIRVDMRLYRAHRLAWFYVYGKWPSAIIDHINGNPSDNRLCNLRDVESRVNSENQRKPPSNNTSGFLGVTFVKPANKWMASIQVKKKHHYLGLFQSPDQAHEAYVQAKRQMHEGCTI